MYPTPTSTPTYSNSPLWDYKPLFFHLLLLSKVINKKLGLWNITLRKQPTFCDAVRSTCKMTFEKGAQQFRTDNASLSRSGLCLWLDKTYLEPIRSTIQIWVVTHHQFGISVLVSKTSFRWRTIVVVFSGEIFVKKMFRLGSLRNIHR